MNLNIILYSLTLPLAIYKFCTKPDTAPLSRQNVSILFYNVENLYDPYDDTLTLDNEFTRDGVKKYTWNKFGTKLNHLAKTLIAAGGADTIAFIGLCEVENRYVLNKLLFGTPLQRYGYRIIHKDSPDARGVDVAALYHPDKMKVLSSHYYPVIFPFDTSARTRDVLYVKALLFGSDTIHLFVNHWPSRRGGQEESAGRRNYVAGMVKRIVDSVLTENGKLKIEDRSRSPNTGRQMANILLMGDFNDEPEDESLNHHLGAATAATDSSVLYNLMGLKNMKWTEGTIRYRGRWSTFDQFIVSRPLLNGNNGLLSRPEDATICRFAFLLEEDPTWFGEKLSRTYSGPRYLGGFSDHLPVMAKIWRN